MIKPEDEKLVVVFSGAPLDVERIKQLLENHNIKAMIINGYTSTIAPHIVPDASVMIHQKDVEAASELIKAMSLSS